MSTNAAIPAEVVSQASVTLEAGIPFVSDAQLQEGLAKTSLPPETQSAIVDENAAARLVGLRTALAVVALLTVVAIFFARMLPNVSLIGDKQPTEPRRRRHRTG